MPPEGLQDFMFTFGENMGADRNGWVTISAPSVKEAREAMWLLHGAKWSFCYTVDTFKHEYFPAGELAHFHYVPVHAVPVLLYKVDGYKPLTEQYLEAE